MTLIEDAELLRLYADKKSEAAFAELVRRHLGPVYGFAIRQVGGDAHLAEDVAQLVFLALARKAPSLVDRPVLGGWLCRTAHFAARDVVRAERRRRARELEAHIMHESSAECETNIDWEKLHPVLNQTLSELKDSDRDAVWLRFFEGRSFADVGTRLRLTENAARMRVERALDKLNASLARRGITSTSTALSVALAHQATATVPSAVAASVTSAAFASAAAGGGTGAVLAFLTMSKIKIGIVCAFVAAWAATSVVELHANRGLRAELGVRRAASERTTKLSAERQQLDATLQKLEATYPEVGELVRLRQRVAVLAARPAGVVDEAMVAAASWHDAGRATPEAATLTFHWAMFTRDLDTVAKFVSFEDDTTENRAAFMAHFSDAVRAKYKTPERILAAALYGAGTDAAQSPDDAFQMLGVDDHVGGNGSRFGQKRVRVWYRLASGKEFEGSTRWQQTTEGWAPAPFSLAKEWKFAAPEFDPGSGDRLSPTRNEGGRGKK